MSAVEHLPGVMDVEPIRSVPVRLRAGHRSRTLAITGLPETPRLNRIVNRNGRVLSLPPTDSCSRRCSAGFSMSRPAT